MSTTEHLPPLKVREEASWRRYAVDSLLATAGALLITGLIFAFHLYPLIPNISFTYLLVVLALASTRGLYPAILASLVAFLSFDFFLVSPFFTFTIDRFEEWLALIVFLAIATITSQLAAALRRRAEEASRREQEARILFELIRTTNREEDLRQQLDIVARAVVDVFALWGVQDCVILLPDASGKLQLQASAKQPFAQVQLSADETATLAWAMANGQAAEVHDVSLAPQAAEGFAPRAIVRDTGALHQVRHYMQMIPLKTEQKVLGVLLLTREEDPRHFSSEMRLGSETTSAHVQPTFFGTFLNQAASLIERAHLRRDSLQVELLQRTDALRAALVSSVSHDLRTPLAGIKAAASSLLQGDVEWDEETRRSFAQTIEHEADRLNRLVGNLLDMSRIEGGALKPEKDWYPIADVIHETLGHLQSLLQGREVRVRIPDDLPPVEIDYLEIDQVVTNLVENAARYTPPGTPIEVDVTQKDKQLVISVSDYGPGIPKAELERIFDKFYRVLGDQRTSARPKGSGLGLSVCRGLVEAHGGHIWAENRPQGGAVFRFTLPLEQLETSAAAP